MIATIAIRIATTQGNQMTRSDNTKALGSDILYLISLHLSAVPQIYRLGHLAARFPKLLKRTFDTFCYGWPMAMRILEICVKLYKVFESRDPLWSGRGERCALIRSFSNPYQLMAQKGSSDIFHSIHLHQSTHRFITMSIANLFRQIQIFYILSFLQPTVYLFGTL